jgi:hypothetical protein
MGTHNRAVHHAIFHIGGLSKVRQHPFPHAMVTPARKAFVNTIPVPILGGEEAPLRSTSVYPQDGFDEKAAFCFVCHLHFRVVF